MQGSAPRGWDQSRPIISMVRALASAPRCRSEAALNDRNDRATEARAAVKGAVNRCADRADEKDETAVRDAANEVMKNNSRNVIDVLRLLE